MYAEFFGVEFWVRRGGRRSSCQFLFFSIIEYSWKDEQNTKKFWKIPFGRDQKQLHKEAEFLEPSIRRGVFAVYFMSTAIQDKQNQKESDLLFL